MSHTRPIEPHAPGLLSRCLGASALSVCMSCAGAAEDGSSPAPEAASSALSSDSHVVGASEVQAGDWPWQAQIGVPGAPHYCGGSLLNDRWVLTAAHCVEGLSADDFVVRLGLHRRSAPDAAVQTFQVERVERHPHYDDVPFNNDVALLRLSTPARFDERVQPVRLARTRPFAGELAFVSGWGRTAADAPASDVLLEARLPVVAHATCQPVLGPTLTDAMLCAGFADGMHGACKGDSGGPLVVPSPAGAGFEQVGVVSWGAGGCVSYGVFASVSHLRAWIVGIAGEPPVMGDPTADGCVDQSDYDLVLSAWGKPLPAADPRADLIADGRVDDRDLLMVVKNWNVGCRP